MLLVYARLSTELLGYQPHETRSLLRLDSTIGKGCRAKAVTPLHLLGWRSPGVRGDRGFVLSWIGCMWAWGEGLSTDALNVQYGQLFPVASGSPKGNGKRVAVR